MGCLFSCLDYVFSNEKIIFKEESCDNYYSTDDEDYHSVYSNSLINRRINFYYNL